MSGAAAISAARRRRAKPVEPVKINEQQDIMIEEDNKPVVPILSVRQAIFLVNRRIDLMNLELKNSEKNMEDERCLDGSFNEVNEKIEKMSEKMDDNRIAIQVKHNMLAQQLDTMEKQMLQLNTMMSKLNDIINEQQYYFSKMQSLVLYENDNIENDCDDSDNNAEVLEITGEIETMELDTEELQELQ